MIDSFDRRLDDLEGAFYRGDEVVMLGKLVRDIQREFIIITEGSIVDDILYIRNYKMGVLKMVNFEKAIEELKKDKSLKFRSEYFTLKWDDEGDRIECLGNAFGEFYPLAVDVLNTEWERISEPVNFEEAITSGQPFKWLGYHGDSDSDLNDYMELDDFLIEIANIYFNDQIVDIFQNGEFRIEE